MGVEHVLHLLGERDDVSLRHRVPVLLREVVPAAHPVIADDETAGGHRLLGRERAALGIAEAQEDQRIALRRRDLGLVHPVERQHVDVAHRAALAEDVEHLARLVGVLARHEGEAPRASARMLGREPQPRVELIGDPAHVEVREGVAQVGGVVVAHANRATDLGVVVGRLARRGHGRISGERVVGVLVEDDLADAWGDGSELGP